MRRLTAILCLTVAVLFGSAGLSWSADFQKGFAAYQSGDYATALRELEPLAKQGNSDAQTVLGQSYYKKRDYLNTVKWYTRAATQGHVYAQLFLGRMYEEGDGIPRDYKMAMMSYKLAAMQGYADAQFFVGAMYFQGKGVVQDYVYAHMWWNIAASSGYSLEASKKRDSIAKQMTSSQIAEAQNLARECVRKKYKGC
jgi:uncharacterized protein